MPEQDAPRANDGGSYQSGPNLSGPNLGGLYLSPAAERRAAFESACAGQFARLLLAGEAAAALDLLAPEASGGQVDLLVIDLEGADRERDADGLARLVAARRGAPVLVLCPGVDAGWLRLLMESGPLSYALAPLAGDALRAAVAACLAPGPAAGTVALPGGVDSQYSRDSSQRALAALCARVRAMLGAGEDPGAFGERLCSALCAWPGVVHAALFCLQPGGDLRLQAAQGLRPLDLGRLLGRRERLLQSPWHAVFPGLVAAASGTLAILDDPGKAGESFGAALRGHGIGMAVGVPIRAPGPGLARGSLSLLFETPYGFSQAQLEALEELADLAAIGLRLADQHRESEEMLVRVTRLATLDALTGVANRRHGETLLEGEIKRARRYGVPLAVIAFDIDRFSEVNERYGHPVGDIALRSVAQTTSELLRTSDMLVRTGGEEFLVIAPHTSAIEGLKIAEKLRCAIEATVIPGVDRVTVSLGVAQLGEQESADALTVRVNAAIARAKRAGRNCVELAMG